MKKQKWKKEELLYCKVVQFLVFLIGYFFVMSKLNISKTSNIKKATFLTTLSNKNSVSNRISYPEIH